MIAYLGESLRNIDKVQGPPTTGIFATTNAEMFPFATIVR